MKTTVILTLVNLALVITLGILFSKSLSPENQNTVTDTVFIEKVLKPEVQYKIKEVPKTVYRYQTDTVVVEKVVLKKDTVILTLEDSAKLEVSTQFLTQYPSTDRLIQLLLDSENLSLSLQNTKGEVFKKEYSVDILNNSYNYVNNTLTSKKKSFIKKLSPYVEAQYRPFNNLMDLNLGLKYNTRKINYEIGFNTFYYPEFSKSLGADLYLKLNYIF